MLYVQSNIILFSLVTIFDINDQSHSVSSEHFLSKDACEEKRLVLKNRYGADELKLFKLYDEMELTFVCIPTSYKWDFPEVKELKETD